MTVFIPLKMGFNEIICGWICKWSIVNWSIFGFSIKTWFSTCLQSIIPGVKNVKVNASLLYRILVSMKQFGSRFGQGERGLRKSPLLLGLTLIVWYRKRDLGTKKVCNRFRIHAVVKRNDFVTDTWTTCDSGKARVKEGWPRM